MSQTPYGDRIVIRNDVGWTLNFAALPLAGKRLVPLPSLPIWLSDEAFRALRDAMNAGK